MIQITDLSISTPHKSLFTHLNAALNKGQFWAVIGKNGTGKTTLLNTLAGFSKYAAGSIKIEGNELNQLNLLKRAQWISLLSQRLESGLNCTVEQSISYARYPWHLLKYNSEQEKKITDTAIADMHLESLRYKNIQEISGGELRKVEIATVLAQDSQIMMLDEPLNHLDVSFRYRLMEILKRINKNKLIIVVTHDIQYVQCYCSHVMMLFEDGETLIGETHELMNPKNLNKMFGINLPKALLQ